MLKSESNAYRRFLVQGPTYQQLADQVKKINSEQVKEKVELTAKLPMGVNSTGRVNPQGREEEGSDEESN